jgi:putative phosphoribosyl transferase
MHQSIVSQIGSLLGVLSLSIGLSALRFRDRKAAGQMLAEVIKCTSSKTGSDYLKNAIVLGIPRGGAIVGDIVAAELGVDFGIVLAKKLLAPESEEDAIGAISYDGNTYLDNHAIKRLQVSTSDINKATLVAAEEIRRRSIVYGISKDNLPNIKDRLAILVDDGAATGATLIAAATWARTQHPKNLVVAIPIAPRRTHMLLEHQVDTLYTIYSPSNKFKTVGQFYQSFIPVTHEQVMEVLHQRKRLAGN